MPTFIMLTTLTAEGVQTVKNNPNRIKEVNRELEQIIGQRFGELFGRFQSSRVDRGG